MESQVQPHPRFRTTHSSNEQGISHQRQGHESRVPTLTFPSSISEAVSRAAVSILESWYLLCCSQRRLSGRRLTMIHRCKSLFSSACLCVRGQPHSLFHSIITLVSLKIFAQKKPTVWPLFTLGFQGTFPSSPESKGEAALRFSQSLPDNETGSRQTLLDQRHTEVESLHFGC